jgi:hypothetical protein
LKPELLELKSKLFKNWELGSSSDFFSGDFLPFCGGKEKKKDPQNMVEGIF